MAHTVCGIDLGAYAVKLVFLEAGFRATTLRGLMEVPVPPGDPPQPPATTNAADESAIANPPIFDLMVPPVWCHAAEAAWLQRALWEKER